MKIATRANKLYVKYSPRIIEQIPKFSNTNKYLNESEYLRAIWAGCFCVAKKMSKGEKLSGKHQFNLILWVMHRRVKDYVATSMSYEPPPDLTEPENTSEESREFASEAVDKLKSEFGETMMLYMAGIMSSEDAGAELGITPGCVRIRAFRIRSRFNAVVEELRHGTIGAS